MHHAKSKFPLGRPLFLSKNDPFLSENIPFLSNGKLCGTSKVNGPPSGVVRATSAEGQSASPNPRGPCAAPVFCPKTIVFCPKSTLFCPWPEMLASGLLFCPKSTLFCPKSMLFCPTRICAVVAVSVCGLWQMSCPPPACVALAPLSETDVCFCLKTKPFLSEAETAYQGAPPLSGNNS